MATKPFTPVRIGDTNDTESVVWILNDGDDGAPYQRANFPDRSVQLFGTFGGGTVVIEATNEAAPAPGTWQTLTDPTGVPLSFTAANLKQVVEIHRHLRPRVVGGAGVAVTVILVARR